MKKLKDMNAKEKAILLHRMMPEETAFFISFSQKLARQLNEKKQPVSVRYLADLLKGRDMKTLSGEFLKTLTTYAGELEKNAVIFADKLFGRDFAPLSLYCMYVWTHCHVDDDMQFTHAVNLFFL